MELLIDTTEKGKLSLELFDQDKQVAKKTVKTDKLSETLLLTLEKFLRSQKVKLKDLDKVSVKPGSGSFSAVRSGTSVVNGLAFALGLKQDIVIPEYDREPNISVPKSKIKSIR